VAFEDSLLHVILDVSHVQRIRDFLVMRYVNFVLLTYLLTLGSCEEEWHQKTLFIETSYCYAFNL